MTSNHDRRRRVHFHRDRWKWLEFSAVVDQVLKDLGVIPIGKAAIIKQHYIRWQLHQYDRHLFFASVVEG